MDVTVIYQGGYVADLGIMNERPYKGWLVFKHPDGQWVTLCDLTKHGLTVKEKDTYECLTCGQTVQMSDLAAVMFHEHKGIEIDLSGVAPGKRVETFEHSGETMKLYYSKYINGGSKRINIVDSNDAPFATLSSNPDGVTNLAEGEFLIKAYAENEDVAKSLLASSLFVDTGGRVPSGFVELQIWRKL